MNQQLLFPPPLVRCDGCGWSWREGESPPGPHRMICEAIAACPTFAPDNDACTHCSHCGGHLDDHAPAARGAQAPAPAPSSRRRPLKKWRCSKCWARFKRPREERHPVCRTCREGGATLFGPREILVPEDARPLRPKRRKRTG